MTYNSPYGKPEGLRDRLADWAERLGKDRNLPWAGLGLIADLEAAAKALDPERDNSEDQPPKVEETTPSGNMEYDL